MKILYLSKGEGADYQCDMLFHGLRSLLGPDVVDVNQIGFMYKGTPHPPFFTLYALLDNIEVDRNDIEAKIRNRFFDLIVYGSIHRCKFFWDVVKATYPANRIFLIDGEDDWGIAAERGQGVYFKRELPDGYPDILPIEFCIPKEKILPTTTPKVRAMAPCDPRDRSTYIYYGSEPSYYQQYAESCFAYTMKKGGWDCCRHYEIMAAGAIPYFISLENCPQRTMNWLPKASLLTARELFDRTSQKSPDWAAMWDDDAWPRAMSDIRLALLNHLTTEAMAKYVLEQMK
jgi:hypothetical protein